MIEVGEGVDRHGFYFVHAGGKTGRTMAQLAEALGADEALLLLVTRPREKRTANRLNTDSAMAKRGVDFLDF